MTLFQRTNNLVYNRPKEVTLRVPGECLTEYYCVFSLLSLGGSSVPWSCGEVPELQKGGCVRSGLLD